MTRREGQWLNTRSPIDVRPSGSDTPVSDTQPENAAFPMLWVPRGSVMLTRLSVREKTNGATERTPSGTTTDLPTPT